MTKKPLRQSWDDYCYDSELVSTRTHLFCVAGAGLLSLEVFRDTKKPNPMKFNPLTTLCLAVVLLVTVQMFFSLALLWFLPSGKLLQQLEMVSSLQSSQF